MIDNFGNNLNKVKTSNKLIGEIENNDLYASDEGLLNDGFGTSGILGGSRMGGLADEENYLGQNI